ncbi:acetyl-CoA carboxylase biotin carboxyl carrier protein [Neobacillus cucumis]|uniref:acetyl-CoA carboxylase biotin carboxyl carrier protein n=1 Tax=Neobacillus cucumis TaxID=1740721 RepID=UPI0018E028C2|nr:acetyl-CoA carboxylase biotin carboxyl carrier protein [Neobacillus cucumis]MBI0575874.1 acetyl-CoA carboxylase biotin carboxyl carrier protein [Neobacillus cucumis]
MFKIQEIREMIKLIDDSSIEQLEIEDGDSKISIQRYVSTNHSIVQERENITVLANQPVTQPAMESKTNAMKVHTKTQVEAAVAKEGVDKVIKRPQNSSNENLSKIVSPMVGTFYRAPAVDAAPFVSIGEKVEKTTVVCILEAMKLFNEIEAEMNGEIIDVLVENGQLVEHGQPLFLVKPKS